MNHPLPKSDSKTPMLYEFVRVKTESTDGQSGLGKDPMTPVHAEAAALAPAAERRRFRDNVAMLAETDDPYDAYRQRILQAQADQAEYVRRTMPPLPARPLTPDAIENLGQRNYFYDPQQYYSRAIDAQPHQPEPFFTDGLWNRGVAFAAIAAVVAGSTLGFALTKKEEIGTTATRTLAYIGAMLPAEQPPKLIAPAQQETGGTVIAKKPIATASLDVSDVSGGLNTSIDLLLRADPAYQDQDLSIRISGLPDDAVLTAGRKIADNTWLLTDEDLAGVKLVVPHAEVPVFDLSVAAIETSTGELAAPVREMKLALTGVLEASPAAKSANQSVVGQQPAPAPAATPASVQITPVSAPPETATLPVTTIAPTVASPVPAPDAAVIVKPPQSPEVQGLLQKGDVLLKSGDLVMARQFYLRAHDQGAVEGALGVAKTYDPAVFKELDVQGIVPDASQAEQWYRKASLSGLPEAVNALARFETTAALPQ